MPSTSPSSFSRVTPQVHRCCRLPRSVPRNRATCVVSDAKCRNGAPALSKSTSRASGLGSGSVHGGIGAGGGSLKRTLTKSKSIRKGLARGSMAFMDDTTKEQADVSNSLSRVGLLDCSQLQA